MRTELKGVCARVVRNVTAVNPSDFKSACSYTAREAAEGPRQRARTRPAGNGCERARGPAAQSSSKVSRRDVRTAGSSTRRGTLRKQATHAQLSARDSHKLDIFASAQHPDHRVVYSPACRRGSPRVKGHPQHPQ